MQPYILVSLSCVFLGDDKLQRDRKASYLLWFPEVHRAAFCMCHLYVLSWRHVLCHGVMVYGAGIFRNQTQIFWKEPQGLINTELPLTSWLLKGERERRVARQRLSYTVSLVFIVFELLGWQLSEWSNPTTRIAARLYKVSMEHWNIEHVQCYSDFKPSRTLFGVGKDRREI